MRKKSFKIGMGKFMNKGYSKQSAYNKMKSLARISSGEIKLPVWARYLIALFIEFILFTYKVPSKEDVQISLIQTIIPLSDATKPLEGFITIIAVGMQILTLLLVYDLLIKFYNAIRTEIKKNIFH